MPAVLSTRDRLAVSELHSGDRMKRDEFHRLYEKTPEDFKAELVGGIVYVASPLRIQHGINHLPLGSVFFFYESATRGVESGDNATVILGDEGEPQPDLFLRILPEFGGQSKTSADDYIDGAPELVAEIAHSSRSIDLHAKRDDYTRYGVLEYLVLAIREKKLWWFDLRKNRELSPDADGICKIRSFPGLWIHSSALIRRNSKRLMRTLKKGLDSPEHAAFLEKLNSDLRRPGKRK